LEFVNFGVKSETWQLGSTNLVFFKIAYLIQNRLQHPAAPLARLFTAYSLRFTHADSPNPTSRIGSGIRSWFIEGGSAGQRVSGSAGQRRR
jgi:hypothetical protein